MNACDEALIKALDRIPDKEIKKKIQKPKNNGINAFKVVKSMGPVDAIEAMVNHKGYTGVVRNGGTGYLCGYVCVPEEHPWYEKTAEDINAQVHGGITYSGAGILEIDGENEDNLWWVGFDCGHCNDKPNPGLLDRYYPRNPGEKEAEKRALKAIARLSIGSFKDRDFVHDQVKHLCEQAACAGEDL